MNPTPPNLVDQPSAAAPARRCPPAPHNLVQMMRIERDLLRQLEIIAVQGNGVIQLSHFNRDGYLPTLFAWQASGFIKICQRIDRVPTRSKAHFLGLSDAAWKLALELRRRDADAAFAPDFITQLATEDDIRKGAEL